MNWLAMSPMEIIIGWVGLGGLATWFYLHHRRPQHKKVSTLRFWVSVQSTSQPRRRKIREPWALLAQLLFLLLLILALGNPRWGITSEGREVAIVLDTSVWSQAHPAGERPWIDQERAEAVRLVDSLPASDRVLLLSAEPGSPPILPFNTDRPALRRAISLAQTSAGAADLPRALEIGRAAVAGSRHGLLVYIGPGMFNEEQQRGLDEFRASVELTGDNTGQPQFLVRLVGNGSNIQNRGITRLSLRQDAAQPNLWHLLTQLKNYSSDKAKLTLKLSIDGQPLGERNIELTPNELANTGNDFTWDKGGFLQAEISPSDALDADNRAIVNLPPFRIVQVAVFSNGQSPFTTDLLRVLSSNPYVEAQLVVPGVPLESPPDVAIYQGANLSPECAFNCIYFVGGPSSSDAHPVRVTQWNSEHPVTHWVHTHDISVRNPAPLTALPTDRVLAYTDTIPPSPLILAREQNGHRLLIVGFDPHNSNFPMESAFPLLMAGGIEWMTHPADEAAESATTGEMDFPGQVTRIIAPSGKNVPFARKGTGVHLLALETGIYRVIRPSGETRFGINTQLLPSERLKLTSAESAAVEQEAPQTAGSDLWRLLVALGVIALWLEWWLYYASRERQRTLEVLEIPSHGAPQNFHGEPEKQDFPGSQSEFGSEVKK